MTDRESFTEWARERQLPLLRTAILLTGDHHRAEDLVQEALAKVALRWRRLQSGYPDAYARQIMARDNISWWRRRGVETAAEIREAPTPDPHVDRRLMITDALAQLTPRQRAVVVLRYYDDLTERDTATALGVSVGTVKSQTHLALRRLREAAPELAELLQEEP
jgi:RNA polymerase sigma-70 factor (sigma-E family)